MSRTTLGVILVVLGIILLIVGLFADSLGIGPVPGYGWKQIAAMVVGAIVTLAGIWLTRRKGA